MKKVKVLLGMLVSLAMIVGMTSCTRESDRTSTETNASIIGTWGCVHNTTTRLEDNSVESENDQFGETIMIKEDATYSCSKRIYRVIQEDGSWMKDGSTLYIDGNKWNIVQLSKENLIISARVTYQSSYFFYDDQTPSHEVLLVFRRQY